MRVAGQARVLEHFTWNGAAHRLVDLYERAIAAHPMAGSPTGPDGKPSTSNDLTYAQDCDSWT